MLANRSKKQLHDIIDNNYAVNSGVYSAVIKSVKMKMDKYGEYKPVFTKPLSQEEYRKLLQVDMMSDSSPNETEIGKELYSGVEGINFDSSIGYYTELYAGYVIDGGYRERGSSGGATSWLLAEMMKRKLVDAVIHMHPVDPDANDGVMFKYEISENLAKVKSGAKSRYYPGELSEVLADVKRNPRKKYAVVGIPEFITEVRTLMRVDPVFERQIAFTVGLVCGHQKSAKYVEALAWQHGIKPGELMEVDFRVKQPDSTAIDYLHKFKGRINGEVHEFTKSHGELFGEVWAHGFFKSKFSDFTDNVFNEVADVVFGDAWLPEYRADGMGNNIVIVRSPTLSKIFKEGIEGGHLKLDAVSAETIKKSQQGLIHHAQDELPYRLARQKPSWVPKKRHQNGKIPKLRQQVQDVRYAMARNSHEIYYEAVGRDDWSHFEEKMTRYINDYKRLYEVQSQEVGSIRQATFLDDLRKKIALRTRLRALKHKTRVRTRYREYMKSRFENRQIELKDEVLKDPDGAILTLTGYFNYGNILQRYALQKFLLNNGHKFVSYAQEPLDTKDKSYDRLRNTIRFVEKRIIRKPFDSKDNYSAYVAGSDQIWRKWGLATEDKSFDSVKYYLFDFVTNNDAKRIAYAASFGHEKIKSANLTDSFMKSVKPLAQQMAAVSMRESSGVKIVKDYWGIESTTAVDPTMLMKSRDYNLLIKYSTAETRESKQVFGYILDNSDAGKQLVNKLAENHSLSSEIIYLYDKAKTLPSVEQWLKNIRDADLVITDSFHGMVFSILFNTPFIVLENHAGGVSRIEGLLAELGLDERLLSGDKAAHYKADKLPEIDWGAVNKKVADLRANSGSWLLNEVRK